ncbi:MAG TPA: ricin-type beta-trefoil lectin domain protein [Kineosporiaceae bacterium]|nr:ricin-type beta-trefoil lectin domain protein [Kineosporiaceae bacterium]
MRTRTTVLVGLAALAAAGVATVTAATSQAASSATVTVDPAAGKGTIPAMGQGLNEAIWDGHMNDADQPALLKGAGIKALRFPGGSYGDNYHWKDHTAGGGYIAPNTSFDQFMGTAKAAGAQPILIANYGSGTPQEAADWVAYANKTKGYGVTYWEIGNEIPGNGHYGAKWETDNHADKSPKAYATNALQFISAMKAVDPSIKIGIVLCTPGSWPDGQVPAGDSADWNNTVLSIVGSKADFGIVHWYPNTSSTADSLAKPSTEIPAITSAVRALYAKYGASNLGLAITELDANYQNDSATAGLFAADSYLTWWENGVFNTDWWTLRNGSDGKTSTNSDGTTDYGEAGIVSPGGNGTPALNTPYPTYYGLSLAGQAGSAGDTLVSATSSSSTLKVHAVKTASGGVNVLLINEDLNNSATVALNYAGYTPAGGSTVQQWTKGATGITTAAATSAGSITVPAYSITLLKTTAASAPAPAPSSSTTTPSSSTTTPASTPTATPAPVGNTRTGALRGAGSRRCLRAASSTDGTAVTIYSCDGSAGERWTLTPSGALTVYGNRCLGVPAGATKGATVRISACTGGAGQQWTLGADGSLVNKGTGQVLDVYGKRTANGSAIVIWSRNAGTNQQWAWR